MQHSLSPPSATSSFYHLYQGGDGEKIGKWRLKGGLRREDSGGKGDWRVVNEFKGHVEKRKLALKLS